ncbi:5-hydroxytryptamine receptor 1D, partial [Orchesella cincta]
IGLECASTFHLAAIAFDRYRSIVDGITYKRRRTFRSVFVKVASLWVITAWMLMDPIMEFNDKTQWSGLEEGYCRYNTSTKWVIHIVVGMYFIPATLLIVLYTKIFLTIKKMLKRREKMCLPVFSSESPCSSYSGIVQRNSEATFLAERKAARMLGFVIGAYRILVTPVYICHLFSSMVTVPKRLFTLAAILVHTNSGGNPVIYAFCSSEFRKAFADVVLFWRKFDMR